MSRGKRKGTVTRQVSARTRKGPASSSRKGGKKGGGGEPPNHGPDGGAPRRGSNRWKGRGGEEEDEKATSRENKGCSRIGGENPLFPVGKKKKKEGAACLLRGNNLGPKEKEGLLFGLQEKREKKKNAVPPRPP